jgi:hypothetical protein
VDFKFIKNLKLPLGSQGEVFSATLSLKVRFPFPNPLVLSYGIWLELLSGTQFALLQARICHAAMNETQNSEIRFDVVSIVTVNMVDQNFLSVAMVLADAATMPVPHQHAPFKRRWQVLSHPI